MVTPRNNPTDSPTLQVPRLPDDAFLNRLRFVDDLLDHAGSPPGPSLILLTEPQARPLVLPLDNPTQIGKETPAAWAQNAVGLSRQHYRLHCDAAGNWTLSDLKSRNGTWKNGTRVDEPVFVNDGDLIEAGGLLFAVNLPAAS
jgi:pSer/pThr/pTyr-binding forkhead associated (FHA) protein